MNAKELMIGDLINGYGVIRRVTSICGAEQSEDNVLLNTMVPGCEFPEGNLSFMSCYARPLPLAEGIVDSCPQVSICWDDRKKEETGENWYKVMIHTKSCAAELHIRYVHELQHALRLCGVEKEINL